MSSIADKSPSFHLDSHNGLQHNQWLVENLEEVDQSVKAILDLIKDGGSDEISEKKPELITHVKGLHQMYISLAEKYDHLSEEVNSQMQNKVASYSVSTQDSLLVTPNQRPGLIKSENQAVGFNLTPSSGHGSSDFSEKGGSEISSSTSDSESEAFYSVANKTSDLRLNLQENEAYSTLLRRVSKYEEELKESKRKVCVSDEEILKLKSELDKLRGIDTLVEDLQGELELAQREITLQSGDLETEKKVVLELEKKVAEYEAMIETEKRLVLELKENILGHEADAQNHDLEIKKLNIALFDSKRMFSLEKAKLECDISIMSEQLTLLKARVEESEMRNEFLEKEIRHYEAENMKMESMYQDQLIHSSGEIEKLKADISQRGKAVEVLNKDFDSLKVKFDMLVAEKDGLNAKIQELEAEMLSKNNMMRSVEEKLNKLNLDYMDALKVSAIKKKLVDELSLRVVELESEVERQRDVILQRCEEKREAIRQLCISIELYRNDYEDLKKAFDGNRSGLVLAS